MKGVIQSVGTRKSAVARATLKKGESIVRVNHMPLANVEHKLARLKMQEPLLLAGESAKNIHISVNVSGGGVMSQADAVRLAIAKGLVQYTKDESLKQKFLSYDRTLLVADVRQRESRKPNTHGSARAKRQKSYR